MPPNLSELVRNGTFRARTQHRLLDTTADLPWEAFALLQRRYRAAEDDVQRRAIARDFERLVKDAHEEAKRQEEIDQCRCPACAAGLEPFTVDHFRAWAFDLTLDTDAPWVVEEFFADYVSDYFAGVPECWLIVPEGNSKTTSLAGLALYLLEHRSFASIPWAASSRDQAEIGYRQAEGFVLRSRRMRTVMVCQEGYRRVKNRNTGGRIQVFAADDKTGDGIIPTDAFLDELHRHKDMRLYRTWRGKLLKRGGQLGAISTAGEPGQEFEETRERIRQETPVVERRLGFVKCRSEQIVLHEWAVPEDGDVEDMAVVKAANPFSGITVEALEMKRATPTMMLPHWRRFVCNLATRSEAAAITEAEWDGARVEDEIPERVPVDVGLDVGWKNDTTGIQPLWCRDPEYRLFDRGVTLTPPRDGNSLHPDLVKFELVKIHRRNPIHRVVMDTSSAEDIAAWIEDEFPSCELVDRGQSNAFACEDYEKYMEALRQGWICHTGDPDLRRHVLNAIARPATYGDMRFDRPARSRTAIHLQDTRVVDRLSAAAMVHTSAALDLVAYEPLVAVA